MPDVFKCADAGLPSLRFSLVDRGGADIEVHCKVRVGAYARVDALRGGRYAMPQKLHRSAGDRGIRAVVDVPCRGGPTVGAEGPDATTGRTHGPGEPSGIRAANERVKVQEAVLARARAGYYPTVGVRSSYENRPANANPNADEDLFNTSGQVNWLVSDFRPP